MQCKYMILTDYTHPVLTVINPLEIASKLLSIDSLQLPFIRCIIFIYVRTN